MNEKWLFELAEESQFEALKRAGKAVKDAERLGLPRVVIGALRGDLVRATRKYLESRES